MASTSWTSGRSVRSRSQRRLAVSKDWSTTPESRRSRPWSRSEARTASSSGSPIEARYDDDFELDVQPDRAVPAPGLLGQQHEQLVEGGDLEPAVPAGVARPPLGQPLDGPERLQLGQREVLAEPAAHLAAAELLDRAPVRELRVRGPRRWCR